MVGRLAVTFAVVQSSVAFGANGADSLFLLRFGVEQLPLMIAISGLAVMAFVIGHAMRLGAVGPHRWLPVAILLVAAWAAAGWLGVLADVPGIYPIVWVSTRVIVIATLTVLWNAAGAACSTRQAKRLFPVFAAAGVAGAVVGNLLTGPFSAAWGTENLLVVQTVALLAGSALLVLIRRDFTADESAPPVSMRGELRETARSVTRSRFLTLGAMVAIGMNAAFFLVYFPFNEAVAVSFTSEEEIATFLGVFSSIATASTFLFSLLVTNRIFSRLGLVLSLLIVPIVYTGGFALWLGSFTLGTAAAVRGVQWVGVNAIGETAFPALFNVISGRRRAEVVAFMTAGPAQIGVVAAGLLLIGLRDLPGSVAFALGLVISFALLVVVLRLRPAYLGAVVAAVRRGVVDVFDVPANALLTPNDGDTRRVLVSHLTDSRPSARVVALSGLAGLGAEAEASNVEALLTDADPAVRAAAFDSICMIDPDRIRSHAATAMSDEVPEVRLQVLHYLATYPHVDNALVAGPSLDDPDPRVRVAAAMVVGGEAGETTLRSVAAGDDPRGIVALLQETLGRLNSDVIDPLSLLDHADARVRSAAASSVSVPGALLPMLDDKSPGVRAAAAESLATSSEGMGLLLGVLASGSVMETEAALDALTPMDDMVSEFVDWARGEAERAAYLLACADALQLVTGSPSGDYLRHVLDMRIDRLQRWILHAMTTSHTRSAMTLVERGVQSKDPETRGLAIEALETVGARAVLSVLLPLLEPEHVPGSVGEIEALETLVEDFDPWLSRLAAMTMGERGPGQEPVGRNVASYRSMPADSPTLSPFERVLILQRVPMFTGLDPEDLEMISRTTIERRYEPSALIYRQGEAGEEMMVIVDGSVIVSVRDGSTPQVIRTYGPGEHVGELALLGAGARSADVFAGTDGAHGLVLTKDELMSVLEERPSVTMGMLGTLAKRLAEQARPHR